MAKAKESPSIIIGGPPPPNNELPYSEENAAFYRNESCHHQTSYIAIGLDAKDNDPDGENLRKSHRKFQELLEKKRRPR